MYSLSLHETDLLGPFRNQIQVTHQDHGVLGRVLDTFLSGGLNISDESRGHLGGKAEVVNKETPNTSLFGVFGISVRAHPVSQKVRTDILTIKFALKAMKEL